MDTDFEIQGHPSGHARIKSYTKLDTQNIHLFYEIQNNNKKDI